MDGTKNIFNEIELNPVHSLIKEGEVENFVDDEVFDSIFHGKKISKNKIVPINPKYNLAYEINGNYEKELARGEKRCKKLTKCCLITGIISCVSAAMITIVGVTLAVSLNS